MQKKNLASELALKKGVVDINNSKARKTQKRVKLLILHTYKKHNKSYSYAH